MRRWLAHVLLCAARALRGVPRHRHHRRPCAPAAETYPAPSSLTARIIP